MKKQRLRMRPLDRYAGINHDDPIRFYNLPLIGWLYRRRVELCLDELGGGERVLEIGFGSGVTFLNLGGLYREIHGLDLTADCAAVAATFAGDGLQPRLQNGNVLALPYPDGHFDSVLLISILEHLKPEEQAPAFAEIRRVLKDGGQVVYGVPETKTVMNLGFKLLGFNIAEHHFSTPAQVAAAAGAVFGNSRLTDLRVFPCGRLYQVGHCKK